VLLQIPLTLNIVCMFLQHYSIGLIGDQRSHANWRVQSEGLFAALKVMVISSLTKSIQSCSVSLRFQYSSRTMHTFPASSWKCLKSMKISALKFLLGVGLLSKPCFNIKS
jgi:hypothetical protein